MKNRAKCKLCQDIIESFHASDYVMCKCGEISVYDGDALKCSAKDFKNFLRIDDKGNEIIVTVKENDKCADLTQPLTRAELLNMLDEMIRNIENLPENAMKTSITHYDWLSSLLLVSSIFRSLDKS